MTQVMAGNIKNCAFWFRLGIKYYERNHPDLINRHLTMLGLFYMIQKKKMLGEGLYRQVLENLNYEKPEMVPSYELVMALNFYARLL